MILYHQLPKNLDRKDHWDLMLHDNGVLLTWALSSHPLISEESRGERLPDHRLFYLQFEGEVSGGRGIVSQVAKGKFDWIERINLDNWKVRLSLSSGRNLICQNKMGLFQFPPYDEELSS
ncbi:MAG: hypothetical protein AAGA30_16285 [Planctomycetota bacterium]